MQSKPTIQFKSKTIGKSPENKNNNTTNKLYVPLFASGTAMSITVLDAIGTNWTLWTLTPLIQMTNMIHLSTFVPIDKHRIISTFDPHNLTHIYHTFYTGDPHYVTHTM